MGGRAILANDEFFAPKENLLKLAKPVFIEDKYTARGKWMDGWETRRRRTPGHDWCVVRLAALGRVRGVDVDTSFFTGNYPESVSFDALSLPGRPSAKRLAAASWIEILPKSPLKGGSHNYFAVPRSGPWTHLRLNIYPDGGVARLRAYGEAVFHPGRGAASRGAVDLAAAQNGAWIVSASDRFFGSPENMLMPGRAKNMGDGWETKRRRGPGHDWAVVRLAGPGTIEKVEIDTSHFKGNCPESFLLEGFRGSDPEAGSGAAWKAVLPRTKLKPHSRRLFAKDIADRGPFSHARLSIYPDGGISRLRIYGRPLAVPDAPRP